MATHAQYLSGFFTKKMYIQAVIAEAALNTGHTLATIMRGPEARTLTIVGPEVTLRMPHMTGGYLQFLSPDGAYTGQALPTVEAVETLIWNRIKQYRRSLNR